MSGQGEPPPSPGPCPLPGPRPSPGGFRQDGKSEPAGPAAAAPLMTGLQRKRRWRLHLGAARRVGTPSPGDAGTTEPGDTGTATSATSLGQDTGDGEGHRLAGTTGPRSHSGLFEG